MNRTRPFNHRRPPDSRPVVASEGSDRAIARWLPCDAGGADLARWAQIDLGFLPPDDQFPGIFRSSCRRPPTEEELATADGYTVNVTLSGKGGSMEAARTIMKAGAAVVRAGGAGVFIDNSGLAHGGELWLEMTEDGGPDALSFAFVGIVQGNTDIWTIGMHVLGLRDIVLKRRTSRTALI